jgi:VanZ like family
VSRRGLVVVLGLYSAFLAVVLLAPTSGTQSHAASVLGDAATWTGVPDRIVTQGRAELVCNALILMPVSALGSLVWPSTNWRDWTAYAFVIACAVELAQGLVLSQRTASFADVAANTLGGLGGAVVVALGRWVVRRRTLRR